MRILNLSFASILHLHLVSNIIPFRYQALASRIGRFPGARWGGGVSCSVWTDFNDDLERKKMKTGKSTEIQMKAGLVGQSEPTVKVA